MGYKFSRKELYKVGERIFNLERHMNCKEGITAKDDTLPERMRTDVSESGWAPVELEQMLKKYYRLRGWDEKGRPRSNVLQQLGVVS